MAKKRQPPRTRATVVKKKRTLERVFGPVEAKEGLEVQYSVQWSDDTKGAVNKAELDANITEETSYEVVYISKRKYFINQTMFRAVIFDGFPQPEMVPEAHLTHITERERLRKEFTGAVDTSQFDYPFVLTT